VKFQPLQKIFVKTLCPEIVPRTFTSCANYAN
jgi:hypothetical protein